MKKILSLLILLLLSIPFYAQEGDETPVESTFSAGLLIDNQTVMTTYKGGKEFMIYHRNGYLKDGLTNLYGLYSPSNIMLGLSYGITDNFMVGFATEKDAKIQQFKGKYALLRQTESGTVPVSVALYGNASLDARNKDLGVFGPDTSYRFIHRISYFGQVIVARKFSENFSLQVAPTLFYFNSVERGYKNFNYGISAGGRYQFAYSHSIIFEYDQLFTKQENEDVQPKPQLAIGWEKSTPTHAFQLFLSTYKGIIDQRNFLYNKNDFTMGTQGIMIGFNVTVRL